MELTGRSILGYRRGTTTGLELRGIDPTTGVALEPAFYSSSEEEVDEAAVMARKSFMQFAGTSGPQKALFLRGIADNLAQLGETLVSRAVSESGLPAARIRGERDRTCFQLRFFAAIAEKSAWVDARIDRGDANRSPNPKPDVRSMLRPIGPVGVFCASNFPLAFSVAGGDTASALAAGNPAIVLAHYSHPGTAELAGIAIQAAALKCSLPEGVFSLLYDSGHTIGHLLVKHPAIQAIGFTGSRQGGRALIKSAEARPIPIPFYAEMSSVNPVFVLPQALASRGESLVKDLYQSVNLGVGQFCTNPGMVILLGETEKFISGFNSLMTSSSSGTMLNRNIARSYRRAVADRSARENVVAHSSIAEREMSTMGDCQVAPIVFETDSATLLREPALQDEIFGPCTLLVRAENREQILQVANNLEGALTATILGTEDDLKDFQDLLGVLETRAGRVILNGFPTGVEVCEAMVHGGPYPATFDGRSTSVGARSILRFTRPVCFQNFPDHLRPLELQDQNPLKIHRIEDGSYVHPFASEG
jgi:alpha-ketoglutaric semialdehyde dehydrogenase